MPTVEYANCLRFRFHDSAFLFESEADMILLLFSEELVVLGALTKSEGRA